MLSPEEIATIRGRLVAHEAMIMAIAVEVAKSQQQKENILATASDILNSMPIAPSKDAQKGKAEAKRFMGIMTGIIRNTDSIDG